MRFAVVLLAAAALATAAQARPGERDQLNACKEIVDRAGHPPVARSVLAEIAQCPRGVFGKCAGGI